MTETVLSVAVYLLDLTPQWLERLTPKTSKDSGA